jgi:hypothetical protein
VPKSAIGAKLTSTKFNHGSDLCQTCAASNIRQDIERVRPDEQNYPFQKVHFDLIHLKEAFNADRYIIHFYCTYSGFHIAYTIAQKNEATLLHCTQHFLTTMERWGYTVRVMQSDNETGFGQHWKNIISSKGITFQSSPPYTQSQNGFAERSGGVILDMARRIHVASQLPLELWPEFIAITIRILNRLGIRRNDWITPFEYVHGHKPDLSRFRTIGSKCYVLIQAANRD